MLIVIRQLDDANDGCETDRSDCSTWSEVETRVVISRLSLWRGANRYKRLGGLRDRPVQNSQSRSEQLPTTLGIQGSARFRPSKVAEQMPRQRSVRPSHVGPGVLPEAKKDANKGNPCS